MARETDSIVQASDRTYELHSLGWKAFQNLCATVVAEVFGQVVQTFLDSRDGGRDGAFHGVWTQKQGESLEGSFVVQCKFTAKPNKAVRVTDLNDELRKAARLASRGLAENYVLFTNAGLSGESEATIKEAFEAVPGIRRFVAFGRDRISQMIRESPRLRMLVPRVYGLGDLSQVLDERAYAQAQEILSSLGDDLAKFVITDAYRRSANALVEHGFVLLLGEPACGKSTIAAALALGALDQWGCSTIKVRDADDFVRHSNPHEPKQFFWVDDAFGSTQLDLSVTLRWNHAFPHIQAAIRRGGRVVFTSRDYIYRSARNFLKESALPVIRESQVVIHVERLTTEEREQILYNHVRLGTQSGEFKTRTKPHLPHVAQHARFSPEIARRLGHPAFTKRLFVSQVGLDDFVAHPMELLREVVQTLDADSRSAIALVFMRAGTLPSPITLTPGEEKVIVSMRGAVGGVRAALLALDGSLLIRVRQGGSFSWRFKHPTIRDAFASLVSEDRELMDVYLAGAPVEKIFLEVSCGDVGLEGAKVIVPEDRYDGLMTRIGLLSSEVPENRDALNQFLAHRCDRAFLESLLMRRPDFLLTLNVGSYFYAVSDVGVIARLHEFGLLPESERLRHVGLIGKFAVETPDAGLLSERVRAICTPNELRAILEDVRSNLLPNLRVRVDEWHDNHNGTDDPEDYFDEFRTALTAFRDEFAEDEPAVAFIDKALEKIGEVIDELYSGIPDEDSDRRYGGQTHSGGADDTRSTFDDVDQ